MSPHPAWLGRPSLSGCLKEIMIAPCTAMASLSVSEEEDRLIAEILTLQQ